MVVQPLGFRSFRVDAEQGFFLNEKYLDLHGVNRHQDLLGRGWAMSSDDEQRDFSLIAEIGATAVRLAHYQHNQHVYDLTDKLGFVVWAEIPNIDSVNATPSYMATTQKQLLELIRQNYNHPSIAFWSVGNELGARAGPDPTEMVQLLIALAKAEDPSRLTAIATMSGIDGVAVRSTADAIGYNIYLGWYGGSHSDLADYIDGLHRSVSGRPLCVSEYGAGASVRQHQSLPSQPIPGGPFHPEEWQSFFHETYWKSMKTRKYLCGKFVWNMFDFASDSRNEGDTPGQNDKGLVTYDRVTRKDAFYWYKANWSAQPTVHITQRRYNPRPGGNIAARVYSNLSRIELKVNGVSQVSRRATIIFFPSTLRFPQKPRRSSRPAVTLRPAAYAMLSVGLPCRSILGPGTWNMGAVPLLCRRESRTRSVLAEDPLLARANHHAAKYFRYRTAASNADIFVLKSDGAQLLGLQTGSAIAIA